MSNTDFKKLRLPQETQKNLDLLGFKKMTEIQAKALPHVLAGKDVIGQAETGSGKTVAFGLGVLKKTIIDDYYIQSLILCPTRELADQVAAEIRKLARLSKNLKVLLLCGGSPIGPQIASLEYGAHIIVGTPGRILDHLMRRNLNLRNVSTLVLDEADRMLDMGFADDIKKIIKHTTRQRQTLLFSATFPDNISVMSSDIQKDPIHIKTEMATQNKDIDQLFFESKTDDRNELLLSILAEYLPESSLVFCRTKAQCDEVARYLKDYGLVALAIHGDLEQYERNEVMARFANKSVSILVATDVAARGLDIKDLSAVINYEISKDPEVHVHRIGRTGRAGQKGLALSLYTAKENFRIETLEKFTKEKYKRNHPVTRIQNKRIALKPDMLTVKISGGKKNKLRPGDILGALTKDAGIQGKYIGKINIFDFHSYVAIHKKYAEVAVNKLADSKIKNHTFRMRILN